MEKKKKRYWLRGLLIGLVIGIVYLILTLFRYSDIGVGWILSGMSITLFAKIMFVPYIIPILIMDTFKLSGLIIYLGLFLIEFIIIGTLIGWAYGKIKNRK